MSTDPRPKRTVQEMLEYGDEIATQMLNDMNDDEKVAMVRDFVTVMAQWQPNIRIHSEDPMLLGISCLATTSLFQKCFRDAYLYTDKKVDAIQALKNALGEE